MLLRLLVRLWTAAFGLRRVEAMLAGAPWSIAVGGLLLCAAVLSGFFSTAGGASPLTAAVAEHAGETARRLGMYDLARARWFVALELLLMLGLMACLVRRIYQTLHEVQWPVLCETAEQIRACSWSRSVFYPQTGALWAMAGQEAALRTHGWTGRILEGDGGAVILSAERGRWWRLGSFALHTGMVFVLAAVILAPFTRHVERMETVAYRTLPLSEKGFRCDAMVGDIVLTQAYEGRVRDCRVGVAVVDRGMELPEQHVRVGSPLRYRGMTIYLGGYGRIVDVQVRDEDGDRILSVWDGGQARLSEDSGRRLTVRLSPDLDALAYQVDDAAGRDAGTASLGEAVRIGETTLTFIGQRPYVTLVVKREFGAGLALAGAGLFLGGFLLQWISRRRRVWAVAEPQDGGTTIHIGGDVPADEIVVAGLPRPTEERVNNKEPAVS